MMQVPFQYGLFPVVVYALALPGQQAKEGVRDITLWSNGHKIRCQIMEENPNIKPHKDRIYYWHTHLSRICATQGDYSGNLLHGRYHSFYDNKNLKEKGHFERGLKHGEWKSWHENGMLNEIVEYGNGKKEGIYKQYNEQGELQYSCSFKRGIAHGRLTAYEHGEVVDERKFIKGEEKCPKEAKERINDKRALRKIKQNFKEGEVIIEEKVNSEKDTTSIPVSKETSINE